MAIPNVNKLTSMLAKLQPDSALQQYAAMHKNDPYIVSLAASEANRRKEVRAAAQGMQSMQSMQEQPKVADAAIAQMAPQEPVMMMAGGGLATLPAPNMQMMADGGIAGYEGYEGYDEGESTYGQEPVMMMAEGGVARYNGSQSQFVQDLAGIPAAYDKWWQRNRAEDAEKAAKEREMAQRRQEMMDARQKTSFANYLFGSPEREAEGQTKVKELSGPTDAQQNAEYIRQQDKLMKGYKPRRTADDYLLEDDEIAARAAAKPTAEATKTKGPGKGTGAGKGKANIIQPTKQDATAEKATPEGGLASLFKASTAAELGAEAENLSKKDIARMEKEYSPFMEELKAEKEALGKRKDSNVGEALFRAGVGMMGGKSSNPFENIAAGAIAGFETFTAAQKADEAARRALRQSEMSIMQAQRAERSGYHKDAIALTNQSRQERQFAVSAGLEADKLKQTKAYQTESLEIERIKADALRQRAANTGGGMSKEAQIKLANLKLYADNLKADLKNPRMELTRNAALKKSKEAELAQINAALAQAAGLDTMLAASPAGAGSGIDLSQWGKSQVVKP